MSIYHHTTIRTKQGAEAEAASPASDRNGMRRAAAGVLAAVTVALSFGALAQPAPSTDAVRPPAGAPGMPPPGDWHHGGPRHGGPGGPGGPGMMMDGRMIEHMLRSVNATDAQRAQVKTIVDAARSDLRNMRSQSRGEREQAMAIFTAPTVDAAAAETLRQKSMAEHDQASKRMLTAMIDVANVLTPQQRAQLGERMKQRAQEMRDRADARQASPFTPPASGPRR